MRGDFVTQLITGKFNAEGKFIPFKTNYNKSLEELRERALEDSLDLHDLMVKESVWQPLVNINKEWFVKSDADREILAQAKKDHKKKLIKAGYNPKKRLNISEPMTILI